jgi:SpoU rRNA methylase family enzyme
LNEAQKNVYIVLHSVHAISKILETAQVVYGLGFSNFVVSKAEGSAAQTGVPEANRFALKMGKTFMVLPDLPDVIELLGVETPILIASPKLAKAKLDFEKLKQRVQSRERIIIAFSGSKSSFSRREMDFGECVSLNAEIDLGPAGSAAIILYGLLEF